MLINGFISDLLRERSQLFSEFERNIIKVRGNSTKSLLLKIHDTVLSSGFLFSFPIFLLFQPLYQNLRLEVSSWLSPSIWLQDYNISKHIPHRYLLCVIRTKDKTLPRKSPNCMIH